MTTSDFSYSGTELDALSEANNYYRWLLSHFAPCLGQRVIEVGAGIGTFSRFLLTCPEVSDLVLVEPADNLIRQLQQRFSGDTRVRIVHGFLEDTADALSVDSVVLVNVLEHIANDQAFLRAAHGRLAPQGTLLIFVPALRQLCGRLDQTFGHVRRYTKSVLAATLETAGFHVIRLRYFNLPGVVTWFLAGKVLRWRTLRPANVGLYDRWIVPWASKLERHWEPPIGQSLIAIARK